MAFLLKGLGRRLVCWLAPPRSRTGTNATQPHGRTMANKDRILELLRGSDRPLTDSEIGRRTGIQPHQQVNQICRALAAAGHIDRTKGPEGYLVNSAVATAGFEETAD